MFSKPVRRRFARSSTSRIGLPTCSPGPAAPGLEELTPALDAAGVRLLIRPHVAHTVADIPACRRILSEERAERIGLLLEPCAMLAPSMLADAPDHLRRILEALGHRADGVILSNVAAVPTTAPACTNRARALIGSAGMKYGDQLPGR